MPKAYHIAHWNELYENNKSREVEMLTYFLHPNKLVGEGLGYLKQQPDWLELYGAFGFLKMLASLSERRYRGWLVRSGTPLDAARICALTGIPAEKVQRALDFFSTPPMDWLPQDEMPRFTTSARGGQRVDTTSARGGLRGGSISPGLRTDKVLTEEEEREREAGGGNVKEEQLRQFAAAGARIQELEAIAEDDRSVAQDRELKKMREVRKEIQKKQARGDFSPVSETTHANE